VYSVDSARLRRDWRRASQWSQHFSDDQRDGAIHHVRVRGNQPRRRLIFRRNFPSGYLCRHGLRLHTFDATAGLIPSRTGFSLAAFAISKANQNQTG